MKKILLTLTFSCLSYILWANNHSNILEDTLKSEATINQELKQNKSTSLSRKLLAGGVSAVGMGGSLLLYTKATDYNYSKTFKTVNDYNSFLQVDKATHTFMAYTASRLMSGLGEWAGYSKSKAVLLGSASGLTYVTLKEYLDGHKASANSGWSWSDMGANVLGVGLFASQELAWHEQKIQLKYSAFPRTYEGMLETRADRLYGSNPAKRMFTDFNIQTYWLSFNINSITNLEQIPAWLNIAVGYGADGMFGAYENLEYRNGTVFFDRRDVKRVRQWYIAPDIDLTKIRTRSKLLKTAFVVLNAVKVPLPTLEYSDKNLNGHWLHF